MQLLAIVRRCGLFRFSLPQGELQRIRESLVISFYEICPSMNRAIAIMHIFNSAFPSYRPKGARFAKRAFYVANVRFSFAKRNSPRSILEFSPAKRISRVWNVAR